MFVSLFIERTRLSLLVKENDSGEESSSEDELLNHSKTGKTMNTKK